MKKLEDIPKKEIFKVPEDYFEKLPGIIQSRVAQPEKVSLWQGVWGLSLRVALPLIVFAVIGLLWFNNATNEAPSFENELASISTEQLELFLDYSDFSDFYNVDEPDIDLIDLEQLEITVYESYDLQEADIEFLLDGFDEEINQN